MATKIPKQYRVTLRPQYAYEHTDDGGLKRDEHGEPIQVWMPNLGFANAYEPQNKAYANREKTQNDWAYSDCYMKENSLWRRGRRWEKVDGKNVVVEYDEKIPDNLQPIIIDNVPLEGFKIQHSVSRYSTSNKLWRILDPRGFELEINTGTMEDLIMSGTIEKGLIIGPCIWKTAKMLVRV